MFMQAEALLDTNGGAHSSHMADRDEEAGVQTDEVLEAQETHAKSTAAACKSPKGYVSDRVASSC